MTKKRLKPFTGLMIVYRGSDIPWTYEIFSSSESATRAFNAHCTLHHFDFDIADYDLKEVSVTPLSTNRKKK